MQFRDLDIDLNRILDEFKTDHSALDNPITGIDMEIFGRYSRVKAPSTSSSASIFILRQANSDNIFVDELFETMENKEFEITLS